MSSAIVKVDSKSLPWSSNKRYKVGQSIEHNNSNWVNVTGGNSEPGVGVDWKMSDSNLGYSIVNNLADFDKLIGDSSGGSWLILNEITLDGNKSLPHDVTLVFRNHKINLGGFTLTGDGTKIDAGLVHIFVANGSLIGFDVEESFPQWFGAIGNGVNDDTLAIGKCIEYFNKIRFIEGTYLSDSQTISRGNISIYGDGIGKSIIKPKTIARAQFFAESSSPTAFYENIHFHDLTILGLVDVLGFSEFKHQISLAGVKNVIVERIEFNGYRGDGLLFTSGIVAGIERHNKNLIVQNCIFDGLNNDNRNAISIIDSEFLTIKNNEFKNSTRAGMPAAIDLEPSAPNTWGILKHISIINNSFRNIGGDGGIVINTSNVVMVEPISNLLIDNNSFYKGNSYSTDIRFSTTETVSTVANMYITLLNNYSDSEKQPFLFWNVNGLNIKDNTFLNGSSCTIGNEAQTTLNAKNIIIQGNTFLTLNAFFGCFYLSFVENVIIDSNRLNIVDDTGNTAALYFIATTTTESSNVVIVNNINNKTSFQTNLIKKSGGHTFTTPLTNIFSNNSFDGSLINVFEYSKPNIGANINDSAESYIYAKGGREYRMTAKASGDSRFCIRDVNAARDAVFIELDSSFRAMFGYRSSDNSIGVDGTFTTVDNKTVTVKDGLITNIV